MSNIVFLFLPLAFFSLFIVLAFVSPSSQIKQYIAYPGKLTGKLTLLVARKLLEIEYVVYNHLQTFVLLLVGLLGFRLLHAFRILAIW